MRGPSLTGLGYRPLFTPAHQVDLLTGMGPRGARTPESLTKPVVFSLAIMVIDGKTQRIVLEPTPDGKKLVGTAPAPVISVKGAVQLTDKDGKTSTGRVN